MKLYAVSAHGAPRWLLSDNGAALDPVLAGWSPYRRCSQLGWHMLRRANAAGLLRAAPRAASLTLQLPAAIDWQALGWQAALPPALAIYLGTPGPAQKAVLHLVSRESRTCSVVVKVPLTLGATNAIVREAEILTSLAGLGYANAPALLSLDRERGTSTQQFLGGRPGERELQPDYFELLRSLISAERPATLAEQASCHASFASAMDGGDGDTLRAAVAALQDDQPLPAALVHGDFAPWNLRHRSGRLPALIDWEDAQPQGLPLHDAYHFLHIQDYLFTGRPRLHADRLLPFAGRLGLSAQQCRRLEIAYLVDACRHCLARDNAARAGFVISTLGLAVGQWADSGSVFSHSFSKAGTECAGAGNHRESRAQMFEALIANLNRENISYCVLGGDHPAPGDGAPDVDIVVLPADRRRMPEVLMRTACATGASLVQAIQHETTASYFILARAQAGGLAHLDIDCYTDYRRDRRTWFLAEEFIAHRRRCGAFFLPSIADEFAYYLLKKVLKQSITPTQLQRLQSLLVSEPEQCGQRLAKFWPARKRQLQRAISVCDFHGLRRLLPTLYRDLQQAPAAEPLLARCVGIWRELARRWRRAIFPTGMWIAVAGGEGDEGMRFAEALAEQLAPALRRSRVMSPSEFRNPLTAAARLLLARIRSTLVLSAEVAPGSQPQAFLARLACKLSRRLLRPDLRLEPDFQHLRKAHNFEATIEEYSNLVLDWLAARLHRRLRVAGPPSVPLSCNAPETGLNPATAD